MKIWLSTMLVLVAFVTVSTGLARQKKTAQDSRLSREMLTVGSIELGIGMGKDKVVSSLAQNGFQIVSVGNNSTTSKPERLGILTFLKAPQEAVEAMFEDGKLIRASKPIDFNTSDEALESIHGLIAKFQESGHTACRLDAKTKADGEGTIKIATINCMSKFIEITVMRNNAGEAKLINIAEGIQK
jgi:hypothetical protein